MKAVKAKLSETKPGEVEEFEKGASAFAKKIVANFKDYEFVSISSACASRVRKARSNDPTSRIVHWRIHEPRWHDCSAQLPRGWYHP